jgi:hypothetical protein
MLRCKIASPTVLDLLGDALLGERKEFMPEHNNPLDAPYDPDACLAVMRQLLDRAYTWRNELAADIHDPDFGSIPSEYHGVLQDDNMYSYTYRDAACAHAAVGAIAPFLKVSFDMSSRRCASRLGITPKTIITDGNWMLMTFGLQMLFPITGCVARIPTLRVEPSS